MFDHDILRQTLPMQWKETSEYMIISGIQQSD